MIRQFLPYVDKSVLAHLEEVLYSGYIGEGPKVKEFEKSIQRYTGSCLGLATNSCTSALVLALKIAGVGYGDTVATTPLTCVATNTAIHNIGAKVKWVDIDPTTLNMSPDALERSLRDSNAKAVLTLHFGGYPADMDAIRSVSKGLPIIEDCAHSLGATYKDKPIGSHGNLCAFSFQAIKHLTTGDGGLLVTRTEDEYRRAKKLRWFGIDREERNLMDSRIELDIHETGYKFHMNDIAASMGLANIKTLGERLNQHKYLANLYTEQLANISGLTRLQPPTSDYQSAYWLYSISVENRDDLQKRLLEAGIQSSRAHRRNDEHPCFSYAKEDLPGVEQADSSLLCLPIGWWVEEENVSYIARTIKEGW